MINIFLYFLIGFIFAYIFAKTGGDVVMVGMTVFLWPLVLVTIAIAVVINFIGGLIIFISEGR